MSGFFNSTNGTVGITSLGLITAQGKSKVALPSRGVKRAITDFGYDIGDNCTLDDERSQCIEYRMSCYTRRIRRANPQSQFRNRP